MTPLLLYVLGFAVSMALAAHASPAPLPGRHAVLLLLLWWIILPMGIVKAVRDGLSKAE